MSSVYSIQIWSCPCGITYRTDSVIYSHEKRRSRIKCVACGNTIEVDGDLKRLSKEVYREFWIDLFPISGE